MTAPFVRAGPYVQGERPSPLTYQFLDSADVPMDLTGYTAKFTVREKYGTATTYNATVSVPSTGITEYVWAGTEWATAGQYEAEMIVGNLTNRFVSLLIKFDVRLPVGPVPAI